MLKKVAYAASQDDTRRTLKGVLLSFKDSKLTMVATDGRRLALVENEVEFPKNAERDIVLPSKAVSELQRTLNGEGDVEMLVQKSQICLN
jgi:DNA polymerase-3 subunit beta